MLSLPKKKADAGPQVPAWHPDLRIVERLPDTKVVRTAFFLNGIATLVFVTLFLWFAHDRWELHSLNNQISDTEKMIARDKIPSEKAVILWGKFQQEQAKLAVVTDFLDARPAASPILLRVQETLPAKIEITHFDLGDKGLSLKGIIRGAPDQSSLDADAYRDQLSKDTVLAKYFDDVSLTSLSKSTSTGRLSVELFLRFKGVLKK